MKIVFSGGGTLGPVVPLLAVAEAYRRKFQTAKLLWVGTKNGPERTLIEKAGLPFYALAAGKWRRYFSFWNFFDFLKIILAFFWSFGFLLKHRPALLISAGGFVSVPLHWAGWLLGVPAWVHQEDVKPGLANRLMAKTASHITVSVEDSAKFFPAAKTEWLGNPARQLARPTTAEARARFGIPAEATVIFAMGGGTGSARVNQLVAEALSYWPEEWHVIHLVGLERQSEANERAAELFKNYHVYKFFSEEMADAYAAADVVVARAGFSTLTELAALGKAAVILPISGSQQEENANWLAEKSAVVALNEAVTTGLELAQVVKDLIAEPEKRRAMGEKAGAVLPAAREERLIEIIEATRKK